MKMSKKKAGEFSIDFQNCHDLIPGLPSELAMECFVRVPYQFHSAMKSVCHSWRSLLSNSCFMKERRRCGKEELLLCLVQPLTPPASAPKAPGDTFAEKDEMQNQPRGFCTPRFRLSVYNTVMATWHRVAFPDGRIPLFCECVVLQDAGKILLIGGWDPETLQPVKDVYILEFVGEGSGRRWIRGAPMKESRSFFACASIGSTKVYVAGGHDDQKNALRSAEVYDLEKDKWSKIPPMTEGRDECQGFAMESDRGFCVLSGYRTESQGRFQSDAEIYDLDTNSWSKIENVWPFPDTSPRGRTAGDIRSSSMLRYFTDRALQSENRWESKDESRKWNLNIETIQLPVTETSIYAGSLGNEPVVMIGGKRESEGKGVMMKTTEKNIGKWSHVHDIPSGFSTLPFSHASIYV